MPTAAELERLDALVRRLTPLSGVQRGALVRAEDWNAVVGALIEVLRAVLADGARGAVGPHEHVDQVNIGWLDPRLRVLLERGPLGEPTALSRIDTIDRRVLQAVERIGMLDASIRETRVIASDIAVREEKRETDLTSVRRKVEAIPDAREDVLTLRETLNGLQSDVREAIGISEGLQVGGQPFDAARFDQRLAGLEELRERLTSPNGTLLDAGALERRLTELVNTFITQEQLDDVVTNRPVALPDSQLATLEDGLTERLRVRFTTDLDRATAGLRSEMTSRFTEVEGIVGRSVSEALPGMTESVLGTVRSEIESRAAANRTELLATLDQRLAASTESVLSTLDRRVTGLETTLTATLTQELETRITASIAPLRADITRLDDRTRQHTDTLSRLERGQTELGTRIETVARTEEQARRTLATTLTEEMDRRIRQEDAALDQRFTQFETRIQERVNLAVSDITRSLVPQLEQIAVTAARRESQIVANQLRGEIREIAREEVTVVVEDVRSAFRAELDRSNERISALVTNEVRRATATLPELVRNEVNRVQPLNPGGTILGGGASGPIIRGGG